VPVVEEQAAPQVALVLGHDPRLGADTRGDDPLQDRRLAREYPRRVGLEQGKQVRIEGEGDLGDLGEPASVLALGERPERRDVGEHRHRLVERADEVLALGQVHRRLTADRRVYLRE